MTSTLIISELEEPATQALRQLAISHGRSMETEARELLISALAAAAAPPNPPTFSAITAARGLWQGELNTDEVMELTRADDLDHAYTRR